jgi:hypothetical protein
MLIFPTGSQEEGSPEPSLTPPLPSWEAAVERGVKVQKKDAAVMRSARREGEPLLPLRGSLKECGDEEAEVVENEQNALVAAAHER